MHPPRTTLHQTDCDRQRKTGLEDSPQPERPGSWRRARLRILTTARTNCGCQELSSALSCSPLRWCWRGQGRLGQRHHQCAAERRDHQQGQHGGDHPAGRIHPSASRSDTSRSGTACDHLPAIRGNQAAPVGERRAKIRTRRGLLCTDVNRRRCIRLCPMRMEAPRRKVKDHWTLCCRINRRDLNAWRDVVPGVDVPHRNLEVEIPGSDPATGGMKGEATTHLQPPHRTDPASSARKFIQNTAACSQFASSVPRSTPQASMSTCR
jgi:hypothetical protein